MIELERRNSLKIFLHIKQQNLEKGASKGANGAAQDSPRVD
jgi:hypothetical protein